MNVTVHVALVLFSGVREVQLAKLVDEVSRKKLAPPVGAMGAPVEVSLTVAVHGSFEPTVIVLEPQTMVVADDL